MLVFFTYLDRSNLSFAAFQFKKDINLSNTVYGLGASKLLKPTANCSHVSVPFFYSTTVFPDLLEYW